jgi:UDP-hydrolysing UDP-N-acetyl-D-glucosamine 2-epimerase
MHLSPEFGLTAEQIMAEGWPVAAQVEMLLSSDSPQGVAKSMGLGIVGYAQALAQLGPDLLVTLGDRFEMLAAVLAALPLGLPVVHLHGGELTQGAIDDAARHAMTKLSHLHFVATAEYARRLRQMGEEPWRITVTGALSLDNLDQVELLGRPALEKELGIHLDPGPLLVTFHPETLSPGQGPWQLGQLLVALEEAGRQVIFTLPNADAGGRELTALIQEFSERHPWAHVRDNLGTRNYFSLMALAGAMVGNSSSGIIEAPSLGLPVVNIGTRQDGRTRAANVIDVGHDSRQIGAGIAQALNPDLKERLRSASNPYRQGPAARLMVAQLREVELGQKLLIKRFVDMPCQGQAS